MGNKFIILLQIKLIVLGMGWRNNFINIFYLQAYHFVTLYILNIEVEKGLGNYIVNINCISPNKKTT